MELMVYLWLIFASTCLLAELGHPGLFFFLACCGGSLGAAFAALHYPFWIQCLIFLLTTFCMFYILKRTIVLSKKHSATNVEALLGKRAVVVRSISPLIMGEVKVQGEQWAARSLHTQELHVNEEVEVVGVKGCHLIVKRFDERNAS